MRVFKNKIFSTIFGTGFFILFLTAIISYLRLAEIRTPLIIHFDAYKGIDFLGDRFDVLGILAVAAVVFLVNLLLARFIFDRQRFLSYTLAYITLAIAILILIAVSAIIAVN